MGPRACLGAMEKRKIFSLLGMESIFYGLSVTILTELSWLLYRYRWKCNPILGFILNCSCKCTVIPFDI
jgi:hypothetical protein